MPRKEAIYSSHVVEDSYLLYRRTISSINTRTKQEHGTLMSKIAQQRATMHQLHESVERIENRMEGVESNSRALSSKVDETHLSVTRLRSLGEQIIGFIRTFPHEIRDLLQSIVQADWRTYQAVLQRPERSSQSPTAWTADTIQFTNVLGEYRELPYEYFCQWEVRKTLSSVVSVSANFLH